jgi:hypothetical protein
VQRGVALSRYIVAIHAHHCGKVIIGYESLESTGVELTMMPSITESYFQADNSGFMYHEQ